VLSGLPAQTVCEVTKVAWPCAVEQAFKQPLMAGMQMDEGEARRDAKAKQQAGKPPPSTKGDNGPMPNGSNGEDPWWWQELERAAAAERKKTNHRGTEAQRKHREEA
jgi:hypothetical protein